MIAPLSPCQQRVWRLVGTAADPALFERIGFRVFGPLKVAQVAAALHEISRRHTILVSVFFVTSGRVVQWTRAGRCVPLVVDLQTLAPETRESAARRLARRDRQPVFDPARGPLMRVALLRIAPTEHVLLFAIHHLIFDGESRSILVRELALLLGAQQGRSRALPALPIQYADVARREQRRAIVAHRARQASAVAERVASRLPPATVPPDRPRSAYRTRRGRTLPFAVASELLRGLRALSAAEGASLFMLLLAALAIVLRRVSGQDEVIVGVPVVNRTTLDVERLIGPFVNILPLRLIASSTMTVRELVTKTRAALLDAFAHGDLPFEAVLTALYPAEALDSYGPAGGTPLFRVCVSYAEQADAADRLATAVPGMTIRPFEADDLIAGCDLFVAFAADSRTLTGTVLYSAELFDRATVGRFIDDLQAVLDTLRLDWTLPLSHVNAA
jgi:pristinamycin I synthase-3/4